MKHQIEVEESIADAISRVKSYSELHSSFTFKRIKKDSGLERGPLQKGINILKKQGFLRSYYNPRIGKVVYSEVEPQPPPFSEILW